MALSIPPKTSAVRGIGLPSLGKGETPLTVMAPRWSKGTSEAYSAP